VSGQLHAPAALSPLSSSLITKNLKIQVYNTIILPVTFYGRETWSLTLRERHRLRVFEIEVLRRFLYRRGRRLEKTA
jgi:hypothetical protein